MTVDIRRGKILFIDDEEDAVKLFIRQLKEEGFSNVEYRRDISSFNAVLAIQADLIYLDITGVASSLDAADEGLSILEYVKGHAPWTRIVVLSGSDFPASKAKPLSQADLCITKASLSLAELVNLTEQELRTALSPEYRNVKILNIIAQQLDDLPLSWFQRRKINKIITTARLNEGNSTFDWAKLVKGAQSVLSVGSNVASIVSLLVS